MLSQSFFSSGGAVVRGGTGSGVVEKRLPLDGVFSGLGAMEIVGRFCDGDGDGAETRG